MILFLRWRGMVYLHLVTLSLLLFSTSLINVVVYGQEQVSLTSHNKITSEASLDTLSSTAPNAMSPATARYLDPTQGSLSDDLIKRALASNGEIAATRLNIERARARLRQAGLRPNPTIEFEQTTGRLTGSSGENETSIGLSLPIELGGKRGHRIQLAQIELEAAEAEVADRERRLANEIRTVYAEALAAVRELKITEGINNLDLQTTKVVQIRVNEGESAPIELNLLRVEVERLKSRRALIEGRLQSTLIRLKSLAGLSPNEPLKLREDISKPSLPRPPATLELALEIALRSRPDLKLARLTEEVSLAGLKLAKAQAAPDASIYTRYSQSRSAIDDTHVGTLHDRDKTLSVGVSVGIPLFNRNQGEKAQAVVAISQAKARREFLEAVIRAEVTSAYKRYEAAKTALLSYEQGVIAVGVENIRVIRAAYELGEYRINDLLSEQRRLLDSQREYTDALAEQYRALAELQSAIGASVVR
jgi:outer membrane protein, heavy metal efflux system